MEALSAHQCWTVGLLGKCSVAQVNAHLCAETEETRDQVVCLQDALLVHLKDKNECVVS